MKVLHVSTYITGGAGIAATRLHKGLLALGVASEILYLDHQTAQLTKKPTPPTPIPPLHTRIIRRLSRQLPRIFPLKKEVLPADETVPAGEYEAFTSPITDYDITLHPSYQAADIINLHWVADFLDYPTFFRKNKKPVVWTLHDMNPFQGGFHYRGDAVANPQLATAEAAYLQVKYEALSGVQNLQVVPLSKWLYRTSSESKLLKKFSHTLIPNGIDTAVFKPLPKNFAREVLGLPRDKKLILFVSEKLGVRRKGFDLLHQVINRLNGKDDVLFCAVGANNLAYKSNVLYLDVIQDERLMAVLYAACDAFILPSLEDNLPNVMLEALACGTPVIAAPVGGIADVVIDSFNGILASGTSVEDFYRALSLYYIKADLFNSHDIRNEFLEKYTVKKQALAYLALYKQVLS